MYEKVFGNLPRGRSLDKGVDHSIELKTGIQPIKKNPFKHPKRIRYYIDKAIEIEGLIRPS